MSIKSSLGTGVPIPGTPLKVATHPKAEYITKDQQQTRMADPNMQNDNSCGDSRLGCPA
jgi:hypothetical protein